MEDGISAQRSSGSKMKARYDKMAERFDHHPRGASFAALARGSASRAKNSRTDLDLDYFRMRAAREQTAARNAQDVRVRRVHLDMAERYQALVRVAEARSSVRLSFTA